MAPHEPSKDSAKQGGLAALGIAAFAVVCCAALPVLAAVAGSVAIGTVLGVGGGILAAVVLVGLAVARTRRRRVCETPPRAHEPQDNRASWWARSRARL
ncbi:MAG: hypothetical protein ACRDM7_16335 [Thermoleophilaceae bacterium]